MTYIPSGAPAGVVSSANSATLIDGTNTAAYQVTSDTFQAGSTETSLVLATSASAVDDAFNDLVIQIINGLGNSQSALITDYEGSTRTATVEPALTIVPDTTSTYIVHVSSGKCQIQDQNDKNQTIRLASTASSVDDFYKQSFLKILNGEGAGELVQITGYDGSTKIATVTGSFEATENTLYMISGEYGTSAGGNTSTTLILDGNQTTQAGTQYLQVQIVAGLGTGQTREITSLSVNTLTITPAWSTTPDNTSSYVIFGGWSGVYENIAQYSLTTIVGAINIAAGQRAVIDMQLGLVADGSVKRGKFAEASNVTPSTVHTLTVVSEYFRLRIVGLGTKVSGTTQVINSGGKSAKLTAFLDENINGNNDCELTRSVITGRTSTGQYKNASIGTNNVLNVNLVQPVSAFGSVICTELQPIQQIKFTYGIPTQAVEQHLNPGTAVTMDQKGTAALPQIQSVYLSGGSVFSSSGAGDYFSLQNGAGADFYVWFDVSAGNTDPTPAGTGIKVEITTSSSASAVASAARAAIDANVSFSATVFGSIVTINNAANGDVRSIDLGTMPSASESTISVTKGSGLLTCTTGDGVADYSLLRGQRTMSYRPGQGAIARFTAIYDTPVSGTLQYAGMGNAVAALYIGYNGTQFCINQQTGGLPEIQELEITSVAGATTGTVTITIDGMDVDVGLTDVTSTQVVAQQISSVDYSGYLYNSEVVDNKVIFNSNRLTGGTKTFAFSLGTATNVTGFFTEITTARAQTDTIVKQENFNLDQLDGTGPSSFKINTSKGNVFQIQYQDLGFGAIIFSVEDPVTSQINPFHMIQYSNANTDVFISQPDTKLTWFVASTTSTTGVSIKAASGAMFTQGTVNRLEPNFGTVNTVLNLHTAKTNMIILALHNSRTFRGLYNNINTIIRTISITSVPSLNSTKVSTEINLVVGGTVTGDLNYQYVSEDVTPIFVAKPAKDDATLSGGVVIFSTSVSPRDTTSLSLIEQSISFASNQYMYVTLTQGTPSIGNLDVTCAVDWVEDQ